MMTTTTTKTFDCSSWLKCVREPEAHYKTVNGKKTPNKLWGWANSMFTIYTFVSSNNYLLNEFEYCICFLEAAISFPHFILSFVSFDFLFHFTRCNFIFLVLFLLLFSVMVSFTLSHFRSLYRPIRLRPFFAEW